MKDFGPNGTFSKPLLHRTYLCDVNNARKRGATNEPVVGCLQHRISQTEGIRDAAASPVKSNGVTKDLCMLGSNDAQENPIQFEKLKTVPQEKSILPNILISFIDFIKRVVEVLLPIGNMVYVYPAYAIKIRSWMDYFFGGQVVDTILGSDGIFKLVLLLEKVSI